MADKKSDGDVENIVQVSGKDLEKELREAKEKAHEGMDYFIENLKKFAVTEGWVFSVKRDFVENGEREHMWVSVDTYEDGKFYGRLNNIPKTVKELKVEAPISVAKEEVEDWFFFDPRTQKWVGGYSTQVLLKYQNNKS